MAAKTRFVSSVFQRLDTTDLVVILIAIAIFCVNFPTSLVVVLLGLFIVPMWLTYRLVETSLRNLT